MKNRGFFFGEFWLKSTEKETKKRYNFMNYLPLINKFMSKFKRKVRKARGNEAFNAIVLKIKYINLITIYLMSNSRALKNIINY